MMTDNDSIHMILAKHFSGERLTDEQEKELLQWIFQHKEEYTKMSKWFQSAESGARAMKFDTEQAWETINAHLNAPQKVKHLSFRSYLSYAACAVVVLCTSLFFWYRSGDKDFRFVNSTNAIVSVLLPDSSTVTLSPQSSISFYADAQTSQRKADLNGQAFFKVKPDAQHPFVVQNKASVIQVLGTSFLVDGSAATETSVFVREGVVRVSKERQQVVLKAQEKAVVTADSILKSAIEHPEQVFLGHVAQKVYKNAPLAVILADIEQEFNIHITAEPALLENRINTTLDFIHLEEMLSEICFICNCSYQSLSNKEFQFYKDNQ